MVKTPSSHRLIPPLENGDRLTRYEFERRYNAMPPLKHAELIEGVVYMAAALRFRSHGQPHASLMTWLGNYMVTTPGVLLGDAPTVRLSDVSASLAPGEGQAEFDASKVAQIKDAIREGRFEVNSGVVADKLIENVNQLFGKVH